MMTFIFMIVFSLDAWLSSNRLSPVSPNEYLPKWAISKLKEDTGIGHYLMQKSCNISLVQNKPTKGIINIHYNKSIMYANFNLLFECFFTRLALVLDER